MKVLLDTNIIVDDALEREPFLEASEQVLVLIEQEQVEGYVSALGLSLGTRLGDAIIKSRRIVKNHEYFPVY